MGCGWERRGDHVEQRPHHVCWSPSKLGLQCQPATRCWAMLGTCNRNCDFGTDPPPLSDLPENRCCQEPRHHWGKYYVWLLPINSHVQKIHIFNCPIILPISACHLVTTGNIHYCNGAWYLNIYIFVWLYRRQPANCVVKLHYVHTQS